MTALAFLVEDNAVIRNNLIETLLELADTRVVGWAATEAEAIAWLSTPGHAWDKVIVDLFLAQGNGLNVLMSAPVAGRQPHQRALVLTNYATGDIRQRCFDLGADRVFDKSTELDLALAYLAE